MSIRHFNLVTNKRLPTGDRLSRPSKLYIIASREFSRPCKIGFARDTTMRLQDLQMGNWIKLEIKAEFELIQFANPIEKTVHFVFSCVRIRGEWFDIEATKAEGLIKRILAIPDLLLIRNDTVIRKFVESKGGV